MSNLGNIVIKIKGLVTYSQNDEGFVKPYSDRTEAVINL